MPKDNDSDMKYSTPDTIGTNSLLDVSTKEKKDESVLASGRLFFFLKIYLVLGKYLTGCKVSSVPSQSTALKTDSGLACKSCHKSSS